MTSMSGMLYNWSVYFKPYQLDKTMPYYVYRIASGPSKLVKQLELIKEFEVFKEAKGFAKDERAAQSAADTSIIKVIFADNVLEAEERLQEQREAPIIREWER